MRPCAARSLARGWTRQRGRGAHAPLPNHGRPGGYRFFAVRLFAGLRAVGFFAAVRFLAVLRFLAAGRLFAAVRFLAAGRFFAAVLRVAGLRAVRFLAAGLRAAAFLLAAVRFLAAGLRAAAFLAGLRAAVFLFPVDLFLAGDIGHPLSTLRTPCASGVAVPVRSSLPTPRSARRDEGRSSGIRCGQGSQCRSASPPSTTLPSRGRRSRDRVPCTAPAPATGCSDAPLSPPRITRM